MLTKQTNRSRFSVFYRIWKEEQGFTLMELVVTVVLLAVLLPTIFSIYGQFSIHSAESAILDQLVAHAESSLEEVIGQKEANWDWYKDTSVFEVDEDLANNYHRTITVTTISNWGNAALDAWEVTAVITHPQYPDGFTLSVRLTQYFEEN